MVGARLRMKLLRGAGVYHDGTLAGIVRSTITISISCLGTTLCLAQLIFGDEERDNEVVWETVHWFSVQMNILVSIISMCLRSKDARAIEKLLPERTRSILPGEIMIVSSNALAITSTLTRDIIYAKSYSRPAFHGRLPFSYKTQHGYWISLVLFLIVSGSLIISQHVALLAFVHIADHLSCRLRSHAENFKDEMEENCINNPKLLKLTIEEHQKTMRLFDHFQRLYSTKFLSETISAGLNLCTAAYLLLDVNSTYETLLTFMGLFVCEMITPIVLCQHGQRVKDKSEMLQEAIYLSSWQTTDKQMQKNILMVMISTKQPLTLKGGGFHKMTHGTLINILETGYSYLNMLLAFKNKK